MDLTIKKVFIIVSTLVVVIVLSLFVKLVPDSARQLAAVFAAKTAKAKPGFAPGGMMSSLSIRGTGEVVLSGIKVKSSSGGQISAAGTIGDEAVVITINTNGATLVHLGNATSTLDAITPDATLLVTGTFQSFSPNLTIMAKDIRAFGNTRPLSRLDAGEVASARRLDGRILPSLPPKKVATNPLPPRVETASTPSLEPAPEATTTPEVTPELTPTTTPEIAPEPEPLPVPDQASTSTEN